MPSSYYISIGQHVPGPLPESHLMSSDNPRNFLTESML
jgi:hypothetical protein